MMRNMRGTISEVADSLAGIRESIGDSIGDVFGGEGGAFDFDSGGFSGDVDVGDIF